MHTHIHKYIHIHLYIHTYIHTRTHTCNEHTHIHTIPHTQYIHMCNCTHTYTHHTHVHTHRLTHIHRHMHRYMYLQAQRRHLHVKDYSLKLWRCNDSSPTALLLVFMIPTAPSSPGAHLLLTITSIAQMHQLLSASLSFLYSLYHIEKCC